MSKERERERPSKSLVEAWKKANTNIPMSSYGAVYVAREIVRLKLAGVSVATIKADYELGINEGIERSYQAMIRAHGAYEVDQQNQIPKDFVRQTQENFLIWGQEFVKRIDEIVLGPSIARGVFAVLRQPIWKSYDTEKLERLLSAIEAIIEQYDSTEVSTVLRVYRDWITGREVPEEYNSFLPPEDEKPEPGPALHTYRRRMLAAALPAEAGEKIQSELRALGASEYRLFDFTHSKHLLPFWGLKGGN